MATEAQTSANRANAQNSTGPRTPQGKAKVAQNAVKHGLLAKDAVIMGEDYDQFGLYRDQIRAELAPVGLVESLLVERIVGLSWRLQRAERFHTEAFDTMYENLIADPRARPKAVGPDRGDPILGTVVVKDFSQTKVLERLMMYERRIENSLYRTMAELRKLQGQRESAGGVPGTSEKEAVRDTQPTDLTLDNLLTAIAALEETPAGATTNRPTDPSCETNPICAGPRGTGIPFAGLRAGLPVNLNHGQDAHATVPPDGGTTNLAEAQGQLCETNPIPGSARGTGIPSASLSGQALPVSLNHGRDAHATVPEAQGQLCETKPICVGPGEGQSPCGTGVRSDPAPGGLGETKPISAGANKGQVPYRPIFRRRR